MNWKPPVNYRLSPVQTSTPEAIEVKDGMALLAESPADVADVRYPMVVTVNGQPRTRTWGIPGPGEFRVRAVDTVVVVNHPTVTVSAAALVRDSKTATVSADASVQVSGINIIDTVTWGASSSTAYTFQSAAFNASAGALLVLAVSAHEDAAATLPVPTISNNKSLTFTARQTRVQNGGAGGYGVTGVWTAPVSASQTGIQVTVTTGAITNAKGIAATCWVVQGQAASPMGNYAYQDTPSTSVALAASVSCATGAFLFGAFLRDSLTPLSLTAAANTTKVTDAYTGPAYGRCATARLTSGAASGMNSIGFTDTGYYNLASVIEIRRA